MQDETIAVRGLAPLIRDFRRLSRGGLQAPLLAEMKELAQPVAASAQLRAARFGSKTQAGIQAGVSRFSAVVRQRQKRTTGQHPNLGDLLMKKSLIPALQENEENIIVGVEALLDRLTRPEGLGTGGLL